MRDGDFARYKSECKPFMERCKQNARKELEKIRLSNTCYESPYLYSTEAISSGTY